MNINFSYRIYKPLNIILTWVCNLGYGAPRPRPSSGYGAPGSNLGQRAPSSGYGAPPGGHVGGGGGSGYGAPASSGGYVAPTGMILFK